MRSEKHQMKKKKKKRRWKSIVAILLLIIAAVLTYSYYQFRQGMTEAKEQSEVPEEEYEFNGDKDQYGGTNILLLGSDSRGEKNARADTIMVAHYHPDKGTYKLMSFMRDMYVNIPGYGENRINSALAQGGPELLRQTIKENFDIDLQYYAIIDFEGFVHVIDEAFPNGVEIEVEKAMSEKIGVTLEPGLQRLDGEHLLGYVRFRQDARGDFNRVERQQKVLKEIADQFTSLQTITKLPKLVGVVTPYINTNMGTGNMLYMGKDVLTGGSPDIQTMRVPVDEAFQETRINGMDVISVDLEKNKEAIREFLSQ